MTYFSNYFSRTTFLDYYLLYFSIDNTSSTVGHGPAAISLLEGSSEPAVNSVAPLSLTPGSRATSSGTQYRMSCAFEGGCCAQQPTDCTCLGGAHSHRRVMGGGGVGVTVRGIEWNVLPCCFERLTVFKTATVHLAMFLLVTW